MYILGINAFHADSSAALIKNGEVIFATEEERFTRKKHWAGLPIQSIEFCLNAEKIDIRDVSTICIGRDPRAKIFNKLRYFFSSPKSALSMFKQRFVNKNDLSSINDKINEVFGFCPKIQFVEHHRAHLASAFFSSPFEESTIVSIDGSGDFSTIMIAVGKGNKIRVIESQDFPVSIGIFYSAFTQFLGFPYYGDEYKVMGLSPYGKPAFLDEIRKIIWTDKNQILKWDNDFFDLNDGALSYKDNYPIVSKLYNQKQFETLFGKKRNSKEKLNQTHKDLASSVQKRTEEIIFEVLERAFKKTGLTNLCIAGGVAQNSVANGKILNKTSFKNLYVPSAGHDAGISMGAAQYHFFNNLSNKRVEALFNANLGLEFSNDEIKSFIDKYELKSEFIEDNKLFKIIANYLSEGLVVGFFDGQAEFGPRALGSRSILADPRNPEAQKLLNEKIKKRESFRPFAPSILDEFGEEYFENYQITPFMERVLPIKKDKIKFIPAVTHVDGSGRLQSVNKNLRPRYHKLISEFYNITGIPILINTSFNENEPVVNSPKHAIDCFLRTNLDILVLGNYILKK